MYLLAWLLVVMEQWNGESEMNPLREVMMDYWGWCKRSCSALMPQCICCVTKGSDIFLFCMGIVVHRVIMTSMMCWWYTCGR